MIPMWSLIKETLAEKQRIAYDGVASKFGYQNTAQPMWFQKCSLLSI